LPAALPQEVVIVNEELKEQIALFRFGVIAPLINRKGLGWGEREQLLRNIITC
jgi:hypothetical protein